LFCAKIEGRFRTSTALALLEDNPLFHPAPPLFGRTEIYENNFTISAENSTNDNGLRREFTGEYLPASPLRTN
jgi:hypothetical protein